jgi:hypothetical protein
VYALRVTVALLALVVVTGCGSGTSSEAADPDFRSNEPAPLDRVSNRGTPFSAPVDDRLAHRLEATGMRRALEHIFLLATRADRAYYRMGGECYAVGRASSSTYAPGAISCSPQFPSPNTPILDFTVFGSTAGPDERPQPQNMTVYASHGFAADGVAKVAFVDADGQVVAESPVLDNVYQFEPAPNGNALRLVAYAATGEVVFSQPKR